jgi:hypothetical protein
LGLRKQPEVEHWAVTGHPRLTREREYLDDTENLIKPIAIEGPYAVRLDVGLPPTAVLLDKYDLDNYAKPLAARLGNTGLVSVWCTKAPVDAPFVRLDAAREVAPLQDIVVAQPTVPYDPAGPYKEQIHAAIARMQPLPPGRPVRLEVAFHVGPRRKWWNLWKPTIDGMIHLLSQPSARQQPLAGRITEPGLHQNIDPTASHAVTIGITASCP